jgi:hypothetical protein
MKAKNNWNSTEINDQIDVAKKLVKNQHAKISKIKNVEAVGYGRREKNGKLTHDVCIKISVAQKWNSKKASINSVPKYFLTSHICSDGIKRMFAVPTDVTATGAIKLQGGIGGASTVSRRGGYGENGTACCYVKFDGYNNYYVLGCAHTFALITRLNKPRVNNFIKNVTYSQNTNKSIKGKLGHLQVIGALNKVDAAVIRVTHFQGLSRGYSYSNYRFTGISSDVHSNNYLIHTKRGSLKCDWVENIAQISLPYHVKQSSKKYTFRNVIRSRLLEGSSLGGDSGSPITTFDGKLIAMHFAGDGTYSYSLPIQQIFSAFNPQLYLVT